ncbi:MAG: exodeoxyribonuclease VII small subunit [Bacilli bacterium]|nr:exodeoxyribonuclease VII small subunit [Bacilli bacterium]
MEEKKELSFEEQLAELNEIVKKVESGALPLDETLKLYENGKRIIKCLNDTLDEASKKIEVVDE